MSTSSLMASGEADSEVAQPQLHAEGSLPGDLAVWIFIWSELLVFALFFIGYAVVRTYNIEEFVTYQDTLDRTSGAINTALLLTASWFVARAVAAIRVGRSALSANFLMAGIVCGGGFLVVKMFEYSAKFAQGIDLTTNTFYFFYLALTFFHFMHVVLGMIILLAVWNKTRQGGYSPADHHGMETGASYWHMVDLVWLILFPLVYVIR
ncbi:Cytochrome C oxidase subunit III [Sterolibacterium denitrificans]|uniref:Cytochrome C oxidase subunit III n=1 Tax=Sterolibacterium denitrificans TaxID=157592 RepID=A0A7Z7HSZ7_9PROT|nr:cytochrome c oxidase subunit 3 family protein [Sterolibacterium denitrificans]SMB28560.1 Cytochrome C oxidase subunit III [Sterolibacterium denitrificans]